MLTFVWLRIKHHFTHHTRSVRIQHHRGMG
jgi:hypothetical protein